MSGGTSEGGLMATAPGAISPQTDKKATATALLDRYSGLIKAAMVFGAVIITAGFATGVFMIFDDRKMSDAILVMAVPFAGVILLVIAVAVVATFTVNAATIDALKVRIVGILGAVLVGATAGAFITVIEGGVSELPTELVAVISAIVGGFLGVLTPPQRDSGQPVAPPDGNPPAQQGQGGVPS